MTDLDSKLQQLALSNLALFTALIGKDALTNAKARLLREEGKSWEQISRKLNITRSQARHACKKADKI